MSNKKMISKKSLSSEMEESVKRMMKLMEEDGDSFAKKAEMYYQKRPELISHVEEFHRMYRSLAERYEYMTGELRRNVPSDLQSQGSGVSDLSSDLTSTLPSPEPRPSRRPAPRPAGFDVFLGPDSCNREGEESSTLDYESGSDDSSVNNYSANAEEAALRMKIIELEAELRDVKGKLHALQEENGSKNGQSEFGHVQELMEKVRLSEQENARLKFELQKYASMSLGIVDNNNNVEERRRDGVEAEIWEAEHNRIEMHEAELQSSRKRLEELEKEVACLREELERNGCCTHHLQDQIELAQKEVAMWVGKLEKDPHLDSHHQEPIRGSKETISSANQFLSEENSRLLSEISKLLKENACLEDNLREWQVRCRSLEEEIERVNAAKGQMECLLRSQIGEKDDQVKELNKRLDAFASKDYVTSARVDELAAEVSCRDDRIDFLADHLHQLQREHVELLGRSRAAHKSADELRSKVKELEGEVEMLRGAILEAAEEKREAIRQLRFSLHHYRNGYHRLREAVIGHKAPLPITATRA